MAIQKPISVSDVTKALGAATYDVGSLCSHQNINQWSLYKPIIAAGILRQLTQQEFYDNNDGFTITKFLTLGDLAKAVVANNIGWEYKRPTGGTAAPYRLTDFLGYDHYAQPWFTLQAVNGTKCYHGDTLRFEFDSGYDISWLGNFAELKGVVQTKTAGVYAIGFILIRESSSAAVSGYFYMMRDIVDYDADNKLYIEFPKDAARLDAATYKIYPIFGKVSDINVAEKTFIPFSSASETRSGIYYMMPANSLEVILSDNSSDKVNSELGYVNFEVSGVKVTTVENSSSSDYLYTKTIKFTAKLTTTAKIHAVSVDFGYLYIGTSQQYVSVGSLSIAANTITSTSKTYEVSYGTNVNGKEEDSATGQYTISIPNNNESFTGTIYFSSES